MRLNLNYRYFPAVVLLVVPSIVVGGTWSSQTKVSTIFINATDNGGTIYFKFDSMINPDDCANSQQIALVHGSPYEDQIYAMYLSAHAGRKTVRYRVDGCTPNGYPKLLNATIAD